ncbi:MAG: arylesterase [Pseudomonadota bacterium]
MSIRLVVLIMGLLLLNTIKAQDNILILGDSLSAAYRLKQQQSWVYLLQQRLNQSYPQYQLINESTSGHTTANGLNQLKPALQQYRPRIVIVELGANDGLRGLPISYAKKNLQAIIELSQQQQAKILILGMRIPPNYGKKYTQAFAAMYQQLAKQYQQLLVPFMLDGVSGNPTLIQADGLHPNAKAQPLILGNIWSSLNSILLELEK